MIEAIRQVTMWHHARAPSGCAVRSTRPLGAINTEDTQTDDH